MAPESPKNEEMAYLKDGLQLKMIEYKGYVGCFEFDEENNIFLGRVANVDDLITFQGKSVAQVKEAFEDAVNEYLAWCKKYRTEPKRPYSLLKEKETCGGG